jgi:hypothetical protein
LVAGIHRFLGTRFANIGTAQFLGPLKKQGAISLLIGKWLAAPLAGVGAGLDVPLIHVPGNLTMKAADEHQEFWQNKGVLKPVFRF